MTHPPMATAGGGGMRGLGIKYNVQFILVLANENMRSEKNVNVGKSNGGVSTVMPFIGIFS
jgi:hypothetical protein